MEFGSNQSHVVNVREIDTADHNQLKHIQT
jgi:hypothetical protein